MVSWALGTSAAAAAVGACEYSQLRGLHRDREVVHFGERLGHNAVVGPATLFPISHDASVLEDPQVKREARLRRTEIILQIADALLASAKFLENAEPGRIRERMKELRRAGQIDGGRGSHSRNVSSFVAASRSRCYWLPMRKQLVPAGPVPAAAA